MLFTGFKFKTPQGYLSEREQDALLKYILARAAVQPAINHEIRLVLEGRKQADELTSMTLGNLRDLAAQFIKAGKPVNERSVFLARPQFQAQSQAVC